jgi:hypothetical protein
MDLLAILLRIEGLRQQHIISAAEAPLLALIHRLCSDHGYCFATNEALAQMYVQGGCSTRQIRNYLLNLQNAGLVKILHHKTKKGTARRIWSRVVGGSDNSMSQGREISFPLPGKEFSRVQRIRNTTHAGETACGGVKENNVDMEDNHTMRPLRHKSLVHKFADLTYQLNTPDNINYRGATKKEYIDPPSSNNKSSIGLAYKTQKPSRIKKGLFRRKWKDSTLLKWDEAIQQLIESGIEKDRIRAAMEWYIQARLKRYEWAPACDLLPAFCKRFQDVEKAMNRIKEGDDAPSKDCGRYSMIIGGKELSLSDVAKMRSRGIH